MGVKIIGLTGGIGSGKSTIANYFMQLGVSVYIADDEAKNILFTPQAINEVVAAFGNEILTNDLPDKAKLATLVFNDPQKLNRLNAIIHPKVRAHFTDWVESHNAQKIIIKETAILFESGSYKDCDKIILVTAPKELRISRVMERDGISREKVIERMDNQWEDEKKIPLSDYIITNTSLEVAKQQVQEIYLELNKI